MLGRFDVTPVFRGHWKGLTRGDIHPPQPIPDGWTARADWRTRTGLIAIPLVVTVVILVRHGQLSAPTSLLTAVALLTGGILTVFAALSTLRLKLTEWDERTIDRDLDRSSLDESVAHLMAGALACVVDAVVLVIGMNLRQPNTEAITGIPAALAAGISSYVVLIFIIIIPRLYSAYVEINQVPEHLDGFTRRGRLRR